MAPKKKVRPYVFTNHEDQLLVQLRESGKYLNWTEIAKQMKLKGYKITGKQCRCRWYTKLKSDLQVDFTNWTDQQIHSIIKIFQNEGPQFSKIADQTQKQQKQIFAFLGSYVKKSLKILQALVRQKIQQKLIPMQVRQYRLFFNMIMSAYHTKKKGSQEDRKIVLSIFRQINGKYQITKQQIESYYSRFNAVRKKLFTNYFQQTSKKINRRTENSLKYAKYTREIQHRIYQLFYKHGNRYSQIYSTLKQELGSSQIQINNQLLSNQQNYKKQLMRIKMFLIGTIRDGIYALYMIGQHYKSQHTLFLKKISNRISATLVMGMSNSQALRMKEELIKLKFKKTITLLQFNKLTQFLFSHQKILTKQRKKRVYNSKQKHPQDELQQQQQQQQDQLQYQQQQQQQQQKNKQQQQQQQQQQQSNIQTKEDNINKSKSTKVYPKKENINKSKRIKVYPKKDNLKKSKSIKAYPKKDNLKKSKSIKVYPIQLQSISINIYQEDD